jgi:hypothetical protein
MAGKLALTGTVEWQSPFSLHMDSHVDKMFSVGQTYPMVAEAVRPSEGLDLEVVQLHFCILPVVNQEL